MELVIRTFLTAVLGFVGTFVGQGLVALYTSGNGWYIVSPLPSSDGVGGQKLDIYNQSSNMINGVYIVVSGNVKSSSLLSSAPIQIESVSSANHEADKSVVSVSMIPPRKMITIVFPSAQSDVSLLNADEVGLSQEESDDLEHPVKAKAMDILINSTLFALVLGMIYYLGALHAEKHVVWLKEELERGDLNQRRLNSDIEEVKKEITSIKSSNSKVNLLLMSRLSDYAKELDFWRDTIRSICRRFPDADVEKIFDEVTRKLKTFGTRRKQPEFEHVRTLAEWIADDGRRNEDTNKKQF